MVRVNFHVHTNESNCGKLTPREVVKEAIKSGVTHMCFTDHFFVPKEVRDHKDEIRHLDGYYNELINLRNEFAQELDISIGLEVDWIEGYEDWYKEQLAKRNYDFLLGSVHFLRGTNGGFPNVKCLEKTAKEFGTIQNVIERYYNEIKKMIEFGLIDCVSHMDLFKNGLKDKKILKENWFKKIVIEILELMKEKNICFEINASGWKRNGEQYPSKWIIEKAKEMGMPITIGNDFHRLEWGNFDDGLDDAVKLAKEVGYKSILIFKNRKPIEIKI